MRIIPVLDLQAGRAVHAVAGDRAHYGPVRSLLHQGPDPVALARAYRDRLGLTELYLADLDAIGGASPAWEIYRALHDLGLRLWVDAGMRDCDSVAPLLDAGVASVVVGLETVRGPAALDAIVAEAGPDPLVFSLDLRDARPVVSDEEAWGTDDPRRLAAVAITSGFRRLLLLDLARVGTGRGTGTMPLLAGLRAAHPSLEIAVGGGVAGLEDLLALARAGASAALVGSALHDGRIGAEELRRAGA
jgi:phosphoribosylformimino-5-aminoimidazole carboxamide ribotide isomerase